MSWVQSNGAFVSSGGTIALSGVIAGHLIHVMFLDASSQSITLTVTDSNGTVAQLGSAMNVSNGGSVAQYYVANTAAGTHTFTFTGTSGDLCVGVLSEYSGLRTTIPVDSSVINSQSSVGTGVGAITSGAYSIAGSADTVVGVTVNTDNLPTIAGANGTTRYSASFASSWTVCVEDAVQSGTASSTFTGSTTANYATVSAAFLVPSVLSTVTLMGQQVYAQP